MRKVLPATLFAIVLGLTACESNLDKVLDDPNLPPGTTTTIQARSFTIPEDATGPMADILLNRAFGNGREFSLGDTRYQKIDHGVGKIL